MKSKALKASSSKSSKDDHTNDSDSCDEEDSDDEQMGLFVRIYNQYIRKNGVKHSYKILLNLEGNLHPLNMKTTKE